MGYAAPYTITGTKVSDLILLNRTPVTATSALVALTDSVLTVPTFVQPPQTVQPPSPSAQYLLTSKRSGANRAQFSFAHCHATASDGTTSTVRIFGLRKLRAAQAATQTIGGLHVADSHEWVSIPLLDLSLTAGANQIPLPTASGASRIIVPPDTKPVATFVDTINPTADYTRNNSAVPAYHEGADSWACIDFDAEGFEYLAANVLPGTGVGVWVFWADL